MSTLIGDMTIGSSVNPHVPHGLNLDQPTNNVAYGYN